MAKLTTEELLAAFEELTLIELSEFIKAFEEKFDVTAAAPVAVAAAGGAAGGAEAAAAEEKDEFDVVMTELTEFVDAECTTAGNVLDSQAAKLAPIIEQLRDWPLQPIANRANGLATASAAWR